MGYQINLLGLQAQQQIAEVHRLEFELILRQTAVNFLEQLYIEPGQLAVLVNEADIRKSGACATTILVTSAGSAAAVVASALVCGAAFATFPLLLLFALLLLPQPAITSVNANAVVSEMVFFISLSPLGCSMVEP
jgi:hypothetical protein